MPFKLKDSKHQTLAEEFANSTSHAIGFLGAVIAAPFLIWHAASSGDTWAVVGTSVFISTAILLYLSSTLYHGMKKGPLKDVFRVIDHAAIFILIAGTYTPFTLGVLRGAWGWTLFGLIWGIALAGIILKLVAGVKYPKLSTALYLVMGWLVIIAIKPLLETVPLEGLLWIGGGGLAYTLGVIFYAMARYRFAHFVWHLFVLAGTMCHTVAVIGYSF